MLRRFAIHDSEFLFPSYRGWSALRSLLPGVHLPLCVCFSSVFCFCHLYLIWTRLNHTRVHCLKLQSVFFPGSSVCQSSCRCQYNRRSGPRHPAASHPCLGRCSFCRSCHCLCSRRLIYIGDHCNR